ncbi:hypothetical protein H6G96_37550 [Nostoc sp. FACHB-892]|nr:hypothetical protein [Nostoc sp. FACHB-892]MBD2731808.1 hypothetical protein [Nostoc sp. FACHB-892]MBD2731831.1 hypothetical protein [Nostoc sp. FACHB-892]
MVLAVGFYLKTGVGDCGGGGEVRLKGCDRLSEQGFVILARRINVSNF